MHLLHEHVAHAILAAEKPQAHMVRIHLLDLLVEVFRKEVHEEIDLGPRPLPVLRRECVDRQHLDAEVNARLHDALERLDALRMARRAEEALPFGPAAVAIHDDGHMARPPVFRDAVIERDEVFFLL